MSGEPLPREDGIRWCGSYNALRGASRVVDRRVRLPSIAISGSGTVELGGVTQGPLLRDIPTVPRDPLGSPHVRSRSERSPRRAARAPGTNAEHLLVAHEGFSHLFGQAAWCPDKSRRG